MNPEESKVSESQRLITRMHATQNKRYAKAVLLILIAMAAGIVIGAGGAVVYMKKHFHRVPPKPEAIAQAMMEHMHSILKVAPDEETRIKEIIDKHMTEAEQIRKKSFADSRPVFEKMNAAIEEVLGPERFKVWDDDKVRRWGDKKLGRKGMRKGDHRPN